MHRTGRTLKTPAQAARKRPTLDFDVMERREGRGMGERYIATMRFPFIPYVPFTVEEVAEFVYASYPSLRGRDIRFALLTPKGGAGR